MARLLNLASNLSLSSEEKCCLSVEPYWTLAPLGYCLCHFPFPWCTSLNLLSTDSSNWGAKDSTDCETGVLQGWRASRSWLSNLGLAYPKCLDEPKRAVLCWSMSRFYLCHQEVTAEQWVDNPRDKILAVCGECGGQENAPHLSCSRISSFLSAEKPMQKKISAKTIPADRAGRQLCQWSPHILDTMFSHFFLFSHTCWVSPVATKGVTSSEHHCAAHPGEHCQLLCPRESYCIFKIHCISSAQLF